MRTTARAPNAVVQPKCTTMKPAAQADAAAASDCTVPCAPMAVWVRPPP